ncbi:MAG: hypothetical protein JSW58_16015 [Candidatus Latescibacterota bacterium]|nr:MAG: hypothetical protein JSW58_16015 [Candidatus Latescibacterota bacterium]
MSAPRRTADKAIIVPEYADVVNPATRKYILLADKFDCLIDLSYRPDKNHRVLSMDAKTGILLNFFIDFRISIA